MPYPIAALALLAQACGYDITTRESQSGVAVATYRSPGVGFASYRTFAIVSRVALVSDDPRAPAVTATGVLERVTARLEASGFGKAGEIDPASPPSTPPAADLAVNVTALDSTRTDPAFWLGNPGHPGPASWGHPGSGWSYPWSWVPISFQPGTLLIEVFDLKSAPSSPGSIAALWASVAYGVSAGGGAYDTALVLDSIDRAFDQSPYLGTR
jgi:hypothetical protein